MPEQTKPVVKLVGESGNAFAIMAACTMAARRAGWSKAEIGDLITEMTAGDYDHLLQTAMNRFEVK